MYNEDRILDPIFLEKISQYCKNLPQIIELEEQKYYEEMLSKPNTIDIVIDRDTDGFPTNFPQFSIPTSTNLVAIEIVKEEDIKSNLQKFPNSFMHNLSSIVIGGEVRNQTYIEEINDIWGNVGNWSSKDGPNDEDVNEVFLYYPIKLNLDLDPIHPPLPSILYSKAKDSNKDLSLEDSDIFQSDEIPSQIIKQRMDELEQNVEQFDHSLEDLAGIPSLIKNEIAATLFHEIAGHNSHFNVLGYKWLLKWVDIHKGDDVSISDYVKLCRKERLNLMAETNKMFDITKLDRIPLIEDFSDSMSMFILDPFKLFALSIERFNYMRMLIQSYSTETEKEIFEDNLKRNLINQKNYYKKRLVELHVIDRSELETITDEKLIDQMKSYYLDTEQQSRQDLKRGKLRVAWYNHRKQEYKKLFEES